MIATRPRESALAHVPVLSESSLAAESSSFGWVVGAGTLLALACLAVLRFVPANQRLVIFRFGRVVAVRGPGLAVVLPGVHRAVRTPSGPVRIDLLWMEIVTRDAVPVTVSGSALATVRDPASYARLSTSPNAATEAAAASAIREYLGKRDLAELPRHDPAALRELSAEISARTGAWGVAVTHLEFGEMTVPVQGELIRWVDGVAARRVQKAMNRANGIAKRNGGCSTMDVTRTTVPGTGTLHHCVTRGGQSLGVLVDNTDRRRLLVYGSADLDVPMQTIVMDHDEADQIGDILHSRSILDRVTALERRFADAGGEPR